MHKFLYFLVSFVCFKANAQSAQERYRDNIFDSVKINTVAYGKNADYLNTEETLLADIYTPATDTARQKAMIVFVHGGGFKSGHRNDAAIPGFCSALTKKGYMAASIDYRVGINKGNARSMIAALLKAVQDLNAFIRYAKANARQLDIDTNKIFISGSSAGGVTVLAKAYMKIDDLSAKLGIVNLNDLEGNTNDLANTSTVAGVYSMWGAIFDTSWIKKGDVPVGCVQSIGDTTIPWSSGYYNGNRSFTLYGSESINARALNQGITTTLHGYNSMEHDLGLKVQPYKDSTIQLMSDFFFSLLQNKFAAKEEDTFLVPEINREAEKETAESNKIK